MSTKPSESESSLRQGVEERLSAQSASVPGAISIDEANHLLHELQVARMELISQNDDLQRVQAELARLNRHYELILGSIEEGILGLDLQGNHTFINLSAAKMLGYAPEELIGHPSHPTWHHSKADGTPYPQEDCVISRAFRDGMEYRRAHEVFWRKDGSSFPVQYVSTPIRENGRLIGTVVTFSDISDHKQAEAERANLQAHLNQAQKMESIGILAGGIAHDFNNILTAIMGFAEIARYDSPPDSAVVHDLDRVLAAGHRAIDLVKQILAFSRQVSVDRLPLEIQPLIKESLKMLRASLPSTISIRQDIEMRCGLVLADPTQVHQVVMNLCTNAYHAMEKGGGTLSVSLRATTFTEKTLANGQTLPPGDYLELVVSDTGTGIAPDIIGKVFDPFFSTKGVGKGTGMGLSISHGIIVGYGGAITVESTMGHGATFHVYLPVIQGEVKGEEPQPEAVFGKGRILFVDDEEPLVEMGKNLLERLGYTVTGHTRSIEALAAFMEDPSQFDLVITDQTMPGLTGIELSRHLLQARPELPIIICTGFSPSLDEETAKAIGIKAFTYKPILRDAIGQLVHKLLQERRVS